MTTATKCEACGAVMGKTAAKCQQCGEWKKSAQTFGRVLFIGFVIFWLLVVATVGTCVALVVL